MKLFKKTLCVIICIMLVFSAASPVNAEVTKFNIKNSAIQTQQLKYSVTVIVNGREQTFAPKKNEVVKFEVKKKKLSKDKKTMTVKTKIVLDRTVANVKLEGTATYKLKKNKWKFVAFEYDKTKTEITSINLKGRWEGTYTNASGIIKCVIDIPDVTADGFISADSIFSFSPTPTSSSAARSGSYYITGGYDLASGKISFKGNEWKDRPDGWFMLDFNGNIDLLNKKIKANDDFTIEKTL